MNFKRRNGRMSAKNAFGIQKAGFSIIELMLALGILSLLIAGMLEMSNIQNKQSVRVESRGYELDLYDQIQTHLEDDAACTRTFRGIEIQ